MKRCLPILLSLFVLAVPATASATTFGADVDSEFTHQVDSVWSATRVMSDLNALYKAGGRVGRADSDWAGAEPKAPVHGKATYDWAYDDLVMTEMASAHLHWEPTLAFAPRWAEGNHSDVIHQKSGRKAIAYLPPASNATFATYATAFMKRYGPKGAFWKGNPSLPYEPVTTVEVWNEPDNLFDWGQHINLSAYAKMYEAVRTAVHRVDHSARVMTGGLAWTESSLPRMLKAFKGKPIDALAVHPYGANPSQTPSPSCASTVVAASRSRPTSTAGPRRATPGARRPPGTSRPTSTTRWSTWPSSTSPRSSPSCGAIRPGD